MDTIHVMERIEQCTPNYHLIIICSVVKIIFMKTGFNPFYRKKLHLKTWNTDSSDFKLTLKILVFVNYLVPFCFEENCGKTKSHTPTWNAQQYNEFWTNVNVLRVETLLDNSEESNFLWIQIVRIEIII